jgi:Holliday junction resolvase
MINGSDGERELAKRLEDEGWAVVRVAGSGSAQRASCDLVAINHSAILFIECKTYKDGERTINVGDDMAQLEELKDRVRPLGVGEIRRDERFVVALKEDGAIAWYYVDSESDPIVRPDDVDEYLTDLLTEYY